MAAFLASAAPALAQAPVPPLVDAPLAPKTIARDAQGRATIRAVRLTSPLKIDGHLDEEIYQTVAPADGFIQQIPKPAEPATETSELWVFFDDANLFISMMLHETRPENRIGTELRRDAGGLTND